METPVKILLALLSIAALTSNIVTIYKLNRLKEDMQPIADLAADVDERIKKLFP